MRESVATESAHLPLLLISGALERCYKRETPNIRTHEHNHTKTHQDTRTHTNSHPRLPVPSSNPHIWHGIVLCAHQEGDFQALPNRVLTGLGLGTGGKPTYHNQSTARRRHNYGFTRKLHFDGKVPPGEGSGRSGEVPPYDEGHFKIFYKRSGANPLKKKFLRT